MTRSLQMRLLIGLTVSTSLVLCGAGLALYFLIRTELNEVFDASLASDALALATLVEEDGGRIHTEFAEHGVPRHKVANRTLYYAIWSDNGQLLEESSVNSAKRLKQFGGTLDKPEYRPVVLPEQQAGRMIGVKFTAHHEVEPDSDALENDNSLVSSNTVTLVVARDTAGLQHTLSRIAYVLGGVFGGAVVLSILVTAPIVRASLLPLKTISAQIGSMDTSALTEPLDAVRAPSEVRVVIDCLNGFLERLHSAINRERAFSANVAHELRTPLAGLRSTIDVALAKPAESADYRRSLQRCLEICKQSQSLTENLLVLAKLDSHQQPLRRERVALNDLIQKVWAPLASRAESREVKVATEVDKQIEIVADSQLLTLILHNLMDNAVSYADSSGEIGMKAKSDCETATISIRNSAKALPLELETHAFDRFWRADSSRSGTGEHAGLGLSLCQEATRALGGNLTIGVQEGWFEARLQLPRRMVTNASREESER